MKIKLGLVVGAILWLTASGAYAQDQLDRLRDRIDTESRRASTAEQEFVQRLVRIETQFEAMTYWLRGVGMAVAVQLFIKGLEYFSAARRREPEAPSPPAKT